MSKRCVPGCAVILRVPDPSNFTAYSWRCSGESCVDE